jgi:hypothetical protein
MGWSFSHYVNKQELVNEKVRQFKESESNHKYIDHALVGNHLWIAVSCERGGKPTNFIVLYLIKNDRKGYYNWGYKDIDESSHPFYYTCPLRLLDKTDALSPKDSEDSVEWRKRVREYHANKKSVLTIKSFEIGDKVKFNEDFKKCVKEELKEVEFQVVSKRKATLIISDGWGGNYKSKAKHLVITKPIQTHPE